MRSLIIPVMAMAIVVIASNILVQHLVGNWLTWGAFTYPFAFLVVDLTTRLKGAPAARKVVLFGFAVGVFCSLIGSQIQGPNGPLVTFRTALGSGTAFLVANMIDVSIFQRLRQGSWWRAPLLSSSISSSIDTAIFFSIAFAAQLTFLDPMDDVSWANEILPLLGFGPEVPLWMSLGTADWCVKIGLAIFGLIPFRLIVSQMSRKPA